MRKVKETLPNVLVLKEGTATEEAVPVRDMAGEGQKTDDGITVEVVAFSITN